MNQHEAIRSIKGLLPEINATRDPEAVLIKYAHAENLSAAQLEKMAHVFNTLKTINVMDKAASAEQRGRAFDIIDPDVLLDKFESDKPRSNRRKAAASATDGIYLEKVASAAIVAHTSEGPDWGCPPEEPLPQFTKVALAVDSHMDELEQHIALQQARSITAAECREAFQEFVKQAGARMDEAMIDVVALAPPVTAHCVTAHVKKAGITWPDTDTSGRAVTWDRTGILPASEKLASAILVHQEVSSMLGEFEKSAAFTTQADVDRVLRARAEAGDIQDNIGRHLDEADARSRAADRELEDKGRKENTGDFPQYVRGHQPFTHEGRRELRTLQNLDNVEFLARRERDNSEAANRPTYLDLGAGSLQHGGSLLGSAGEVLSGLNQTVSDGMGGGLRSARDMASNYVDMVSPEARKRDAKLLKAHNSTRAVANLQRLMLTDPIISQADPDQVVNAYNSLRARNPELVADINVARSLLRESLQYPHMPLNTLQSLITSREQAMKTKVHEKQISETSAGPSAPPTKK